jgi:hypothetical protein
MDCLSAYNARNASAFFPRAALSDVVGKSENNTTLTLTLQRNSLSLKVDKLHELQKVRRTGDLFQKDD